MEQKDPKKDNALTSTIKKMARTYSEDEMALIGDLVSGTEKNKKRYVALISEQVLGVDKQGNLRPFEDLALLLHYSKKTGLDPLARQIYGVYRWDTKLGRDKMTLQTSIDGFRLTAQRTGEYGGADDIVYEEGKDEIKPVKATATVYRINRITGERMPFTASARWSEYALTTGLWGSKPYLMLGKCAEALVLRKAFPQELSGLYTEDELPIETSRSITSNLVAPPKKNKKPDVVAPVEVDEGVVVNDTDAPQDAETPETPNDTPVAPKIERSSAKSILDEKLKDNNDMKEQ